MSCLSEEAQRFIEGVQALAFTDPLFIRGSLIESPNPFYLSDIDLIVLLRSEDIHKRTHQIEALSHRSLDIKWLSEAQVQGDLVQRALLNHRSLQIAGPPIHLPPVPADFNFAWEHWCTYFPSGMPKRLSTQDPFALIFFKQLMRCCGVLSYLQSPEGFTRDIDSCHHIAAEFGLPDAEALRDFRSALEAKEDAQLNIAKHIRFLQIEFDK